ncbi:MAG: hypothetical protein ABI743_09900 [bacterium]
MKQWLLAFAIDLLLACAIAWAIDAVRGIGLKDAVADFFGQGPETHQRLPTAFRVVFQAMLLFSLLVARSVSPGQALVGIMRVPTSERREYRTSANKAPNARHLMLAGLLDYLLLLGIALELVRLSFLPLGFPLPTIGIFDLVVATLLALALLVGLRTLCLDLALTPTPGMFILGIRPVTVHVSPEALSPASGPLILGYRRRC